MMYVTMQQAPELWVLCPALLGGCGGVGGARLCPGGCEFSGNRSSIPLPSAVLLK